MVRIERRLTPLRAIRAKCLDCCSKQPSEVRNCESLECPLYPYRFGKNPNRAGIGKNNGCFSQKKPTQTTISNR